MDALFSLCFAVLVSISICPGSTYVEGAQEKVGVNYGVLGNNLPNPHDTVAKFVELQVPRIRMFSPNLDVLQALHDTKISVVLGTLNADIPPLAADPLFAQHWVNDNIVPHATSVMFRYICVGNEVIPGDLANNVLPAMKNLQDALRVAGFPNILVSTAISMAPIGTSYPPSSGSFSPETLPIMSPIAAFLAANNAPLLVNVYPYFPYIADPVNVGIEYALGNSTTVVVRDGPFSYYNLFDAMVDAVYAALEKVGAPGLEIVISETGWPSGGGGGVAETVINAQAYNNIIALKSHIGIGTPKKLDKVLEKYIFAFYNENQKPEGTEQHFGLFNPDLTPVYQFTF